MKKLKGERIGGTKRTGEKRKGRLAIVIVTTSEVMWSEGKRESVTHFLSYRAIRELEVLRYRNSCRRYLPTPSYF